MGCGCSKNPQQAVAVPSAKAKAQSKDKTPPRTPPKQSETPVPSSVQEEEDELFLTRTPVVPLTERAIHPLFLNALCQVEVDIPNRGKTKLGDLLTFELVNFFVKPFTKVSDCCLVETIWMVEHGQHQDPTLKSLLDKYNSYSGGGKPFCGPSNYFVSHAWSYKLSDLKDMVMQHYESVTGSEYKWFECYYWLDVLAVAQNFTGDFKRHPDGNFPAVIKSCEAVVFTIYPWKQPIAPNRIWCLFEALTAAELGVDLQFQLDSDFKRQTQPIHQLEQGLLKTVVNALDVGKAQATVESDRQYIMGMLEKRPGGVGGFNTLMQGLLKSRLLEALLLRAVTTQTTKADASSLFKDGATFFYRTLKFRFARVTDISMDLIAQALRNNQCLTSLDLTPPNDRGLITAKGIFALADALQHNTTLTELDISYNPSIDDPGVLGLVGVLKANKCRLKSLRLTRTAIGDQALDGIGDMLQHNTTLTSLDISTNDEITPDGLAYFFGKLHSSKVLHSLNLAHLPAGLEEAPQALADMLKSNTSLKSLNLSSCKFKDSSAKVLAQGLAANKSLTSLDLTLNQLGDAGAKAIGDAIAVNAALDDLRLKDCDISEQGAAQLRECLARNTTLGCIDLSANRFDSKTWSSITSRYKSLHMSVRMDDGVTSPERLRNGNLGSFQTKSTLSKSNLTSFSPERERNRSMRVASGLDSPRVKSATNSMTSTMSRFADAPHSPAYVKGAVA